MDGSNESPHPEVVMIFATSLPRFKAFLGDACDKGSDLACATLLVTAFVLPAARRSVVAASRCVLCDVRNAGWLLIQNSTGMLYGGRYPGFLGSVRESPITPGEWFAMEVIAEGNHLVIKVNGQTTSDYTDEEWRFIKGHIALQQFTLNPEFRKVEIKELP